LKVRSEEGKDNAERPRTQRSRGDGEQKRKVGSKWLVTRSGQAGDSCLVSSRMGRIPPHPAVFVRVASKGLTAYGTWKSVRKMEDAAATEARRHRAEEEEGWFVSGIWLTIITALPLFFVSVASKELSPAASGLESTLAGIV